MVYVHVVLWLFLTADHGSPVCLLANVDNGSKREVPYAWAYQENRGWRANMHRTLTAEDYQTPVDKYVEVPVDAKLFVLARPDLLDREKAEQ
jgi:hypothetical protein